METVKVKVAAYEESKLTIKKIQEELRREQEKLIILEKEILGLDPSLIAPNPSDSIQGLPTEILSMIFTYFVQDKPTHIRRLLLVCRQWFSIIMNSPYLWTYIQIIPDSTFNQSELLSLSTYVCACIERSQDKFLNITVDYGKYKALHEHYTSLLRRELGGLLEDSSLLDVTVVGEEEADFRGYIFKDYERSVEERNDDFKEWLKNIEWSSCPVRSQLRRYFLLPLQHLVGKKGQTMRRWESIKLIFPSDQNFREYYDLATGAMGLFTYPTPFLKIISLNGLHGVPSSPSSPKAFPNAPLLTTLHLFTDTIQGISPLINPSGLVDLYVNIANFDQLRLLTLSKRLRRLCLILPRRSARFQVSFSLNLEFPDLQELTCGGHIPLDLRDSILAPFLETLHLKDDQAFDSVKGCSFVPHITRLVISRGAVKRSASTPAYLVHERVLILQEFASVKEICIHPVHKAVVEGYLSQLCDS